MHQGRPEPLWRRWDVNMGSFVLTAVDANRVLLALSVELTNLNELERAKDRLSTLSPFGELLEVGNWISIARKLRL